MKTSRIEIDFLSPVDFPDGWERALDGLLSIVCKAWEADNPGHVMWVAGVGGKPIWNEPNEPDFDMSILSIEVYAREATEKEIARGRCRARKQDPESELEILKEKARRFLSEHETHCVGSLGDTEDDLSDLLGAF